MQYPVRFALALATLAALFAPAAHAAVTYCVGTPAELQAALDDAETDGDDSRIDVRAGSYALGSDLRYEPVGEHFLPAGALQIEGGYGPGCAARVDDASATVLHGDGSTALRIYTESSSLMLKTLSFDGASIVAADSVFAEGCFSSHLEFELRRIRVDGGMLAIDGAKCHDTVVRDSLLVNGHSNDGSIPSDASLYAYLVEEDGFGTSSALTLINTTIAEGRAYFDSCCDYRGIAYLYNSVFRASGDEIIARGTNVYARFNRYDGIDFSATSELPAGSLLAGSSDNTTANPDLDAGYRPNPDSPMVNSGTSGVPEGLLSYDVYGGPRVIGPAVDRGALESPVDGSSVYVVTNANASGAGSLAAALDLANDDSGFNRIEFDIPGSCPRRITLAGTLHVRESVEIDATTQPGSAVNTEGLFWNAVPCVILDGAGVVGTGILTDPGLGAGRLVVSGLAFERFATALLLTFGDDDLVYGSQFGGRIGDAGPLLRGNDNAITVAAPATAIVGGSDDALANLVGGSSGAGIVVTGNSDGNQIVNNRIGVDKDVVHDLPNQDGVRVFTTGNHIAGNRISANARDGIVLSGDRAHDNTIRDNTIGGNFADGFLALDGNGRMGVMVDDGAYGNAIGPGNLIARNGDSGVRVTSAAMGRNRIVGNDVGRNGAPGIDLGANGVDDNDFDPLICNVTTGCAGNRGQNYPRFDFAYLFDAGATIYLYVSGRLTTTYSTAPYRIDVYASDDCDVSGHGQGERWLGSRSLVVAMEGICADNNCTATFGFPLDVTGAAIGDAVSATATSPSGDTSEFSECISVEDGQVATDRIFADDFES